MRNRLHHTHTHNLSNVHNVIQYIQYTVHALHFILHSYTNFFLEYFLFLFHTTLQCGYPPKKKLDLNLGYANFTQFKNLLTWVLCKIICLIVSTSFPLIPNILFIIPVFPSVATPLLSNPHPQLPPLPLNLPPPPLPPTEAKWTNHHIIQHYDAFS